MFADVNGIKLNYDSAGEGEPVLLIAGFGSNRRFWKGMVPLLDGCRMVMPDNRGVGETQYSGGFTIDDMADDARLLMRSLGYDRFHVVGWSMGSHIAQSLAVRYPDEVKSLTLVSTYMRRPARSAYMLGNMVQLAIDGRASLDALYIAVNSFCYPESVFREAERTGEPVPVPRRPMDPEHLMDQLRAVDGFDPGAMLMHVRAPTMVVQGTADMMTEFSDGKEVADRIPGCKLLPIEGAGHNVPPESYGRELLSHIRDNS